MRGAKEAHNVLPKCRHSDIDIVVLYNIQPIHMDEVDIVRGVRLPQRGLRTAHSFDEMFGQDIFAPANVLPEQVDTAERRANLLLLGGCRRRRGIVTKKAFQHAKDSLEVFIGALDDFFDRAVESHNRLADACWDFRGPVHGDRATQDDVTSKLNSVSFEGS